MTRAAFRWGWLLSLLFSRKALAGMPSPLPTPFTADKFPHVPQLSPWIDERLQALSFFIVTLLCVALLVRWLWNLARHDWPSLPILSYRSAVVATVLWGLVSIVVLTMISGARELMTPGAWKKQGWTYRLEQHSPSEPHFRIQRRERLEALRLTLLQYAVTHSGQYPASKTDVNESWAIPAHPGFEFAYQPGQTSSHVLVYEPELGDPERFVLLASGMIGSMRTPELDAALADTPATLSGDAP